MSDLSDYMEQNVRDWMSQGTAFPSAPGTLYIALFTADPGESGASDEVSAADYSRVAVSTGAPWNTTLNPTEFVNANDITFGEATNDWGTITHVGLYDDTIANNGNMLASFALSSNKTINSGDEAIFRSGDLSFEVA